MSGVVISKSPSVVVAPSETVTAAGDITLSSYDDGLVSLPVTVSLVFEHPIQEPVETIKRGLSRALVHYYPIAGATPGEVVIKCTGDGVAFVAASANCAIKDFSDPSLKEELAVLYPAAADGLCRYSDPLLLMQVTVFSCGGFVLGVTWNHAIADGLGMGQFLQAVGELCRGLPAPSVVPVRQADSLILGPPPVFTKYGQWLSSLQTPKMVLLDINIESSLIQHIKHKYSSTYSGQPCSVFEAVAAVLWRCRSRVITSDPEALTVLTFGSNARKYAGAKQGYYGNCLLPRLLTARAGAVANGDFMDLVKMIHRAKGRMPDQSDMDELLKHFEDWYNLLGLTSWRNIGLEAPNFGAGRPATVMAHWQPERSHMPYCWTCIPCKDGYNVLSLCVKEDHAAAFLQELAGLHLKYI